VLEAALEGRRLERKVADWRGLAASAPLRAATNRPLGAKGRVERWGHWSSGFASHLFATAGFED